MANAPASEIETSAELVRKLLHGVGAPHPDEPLVLASSGWDNDVWRLGDNRAVRLPRRAIAAQLITNEQNSLPTIAALLAPTGVLVPEPLIAASASSLFPHPWSVVSFFEGTTALDEPRRSRTQWAPALANALSHVHSPGPVSAPHNPYRGVPLTARDDVMRERMSTLGMGGAVEAAWDAAVAAPAWGEDPVWIHGDLHPDNIVVRDGSLHALIDFGDVTAGDPAYDLAIAWIAFDEAGRRAFQAASAHVDADTWTRAQGWAAATAVTLLAFSDDKPRYQRLATAIVTELERS